MNTIELIRAEIERQMNEYTPTVGGVDETTGAHIALSKLLSFLDTLEEEPVDLEKEFQEFRKDHPFPWSSAYINAEYIEELCMCVARHFFELGRSEKPNNHECLADDGKTLDEAARKYAHCPFTDDDGNFHEDAVDANAYCDFKAGAEWDREQYICVGRHAINEFAAPDEFYIRKK